MMTLREQLEALPDGSLQVGPYAKPLTAAEVFEVDTALDSWDEAGYIGERLEDDTHVAAVAIVVDRVAHLREPGGKRKTIALPRGAELTDHYNIGGVLWTVHHVETINPNERATSP